MNRHRWLALVGLLSSAPAYAQSSAPAAQLPVFRSGVDLVRLDIRVTDEAGRPVADLRPDEVRIEEGGTPRPVVLFQHVEAPRTTYTEAAQRTISAQVSTNQGAPHGHVYVLVFDESHILPGHELRARLAAERFLRASVRPGDRVALYALPGPGPQIEFTGDVSRVLHQLTAVRGVGEETGVSTLGTMRTYEAYEIARGNQVILERQVNLLAQNRLGSDVRTAGSNRSSAAADYEDPAAVRRTLLEDARSFVARADGDSRRFLLALADVVRSLRSVDGRKAVILLSEGFQIDNVTHELEAVAAAAAQSYAVIYSLDLNPRGVDAGDEAPRGGERITEIRDRLQSLGSLSSETGGTLVNDAIEQLDPALARIADTTEDYYLVGFTPAASDSGDRDRYRRIRVTITRPGAHVSARTGYMPNPGPAPADTRRAIDAALRAPFSRQDLRVEYTTYTLRGTAPDMQRVILSLAAELPVVSGGAQPADVVYVVRDVETGKVAASGSDRVSLPDGPSETGATTGVGRYRVQFELRPGTYLMRVVVREPGGLVGSADRRFQVRALDSTDVTASDLVLGSTDMQGLPVRAEAYVADELTGVLELYGRTESQLEGATVTAALVPLNGGPDVLSTRGDLGPIRPASPGVSRGVHVSLPLTTVAPGEYLVHATVGKGGETITELLRDVTVRAGARASTAATSAGSTPFEPLYVLRGDVARRVLEAIQTRTQGTALEAMSRAALSGNWSVVDAALRSSTSSSTDESVLRGMAALRSGDYASAVAALRAAQNTGGADPALAFILGWAHAGAGDNPAAITAWRNAVQGDPALVPAYLALVDAYVRLGHPELAVQVLKTGLQVLPGSPELLERLERVEKR
jgi:VWFA-related protein